MTGRTRTLTLRALQLLGLLALLGSGLAAQSARLDILPLEPQPLGQRVVVEVRLSDAAGTPLASKGLELFLNGQRIRRADTNSAGLATVAIEEALPAGRYELTATFSDAAHGDARAAATFSVQAADLAVRVVPARAGLQFSLGDRIFTTGADGVARISVADSGSYRLTFLPPEDAAGVRVRFNRWKDNIFVPYRDIAVPRQRPLELGLEISYLVSPAFVDLAGRPVDAERVSKLTMTSSYGTAYELTGGQAVWLQSNNVLRRTWGLEEKKITYSLQSVIIDGSDVVNRGQQRFQFQPNSTWTIETLLYNARFRAVDAVFGFPVGAGLSVEYPDGRTETFPFGPNKEVELSGLARGLYKVQVTGMRGLAPVTPVALSRTQDEELKVLSALTIGVGFGLGLILAVGLLLYGRPHLLGLKLKRRTAPTYGPSPTAYHTKAVVTSRSEAHTSKGNSES